MSKPPDITPLREYLQANLPQAETVLREFVTTTENSAMRSEIDLFDDIWSQVVEQLRSSPAIKPEEWGLTEEEKTEEAVLKFLGAEGLAFKSIAVCLVAVAFVIFMKSSKAKTEDEKKKFVLDLAQRLAVPDKEHGRLVTFLLERLEDKLVLRDEVFDGGFAA